MPMILLVDDDDGALLGILTRTAEGHTWKVHRGAADEPWPGTVGELRRLLGRVRMTAADAFVTTVDELPTAVGSAENEAASSQAEPLTLAEVERRHIERVLELHDGNRSATARALGISRAALYDKMDRFDLRGVGL